MMAHVYASELRIVDSDDDTVLSLTPIQGLWTEEQDLTMTDHRLSLRKPVRLRAGGMRLVRPHPGGRRSPTPREAAQGCDTIVRVGDRPYCSDADSSVAPEQSPRL